MPLRVKVTVSVVFLGLLAGCNPAGSAPASPTIPMALMATTELSTAAVTAAYTQPASTETQTSSPTKTQLPSTTARPSPTPSVGFLPTIRPTPTHGLPPTATLSPREECPPATNEKSDIHLVEEMDDYGPQILTFIRSHGGRADLKEQLEKLGKGFEGVNKETGEKEWVFFPNIADFTEADLTGDQSKEIIITLYSLINGYYDMGIFVVGCGNHQFLMLSGGDNFIFHHAADPWSRIVDIRDLNANGLLELVISVGSVVTGSGEADVYTIVLEWNETVFRSLIYPDLEDPWTAGSATFMQDVILKDIDHNGTIELLFPHYGKMERCDLEMGPITQWSAVYMWDGEYYRYIWKDPGVPEFHFQAALDGDYYSLIGLFDRAETSYLRAVFDESLKPGSTRIGKEDAKCPLGPDENPIPPSRRGSGLTRAFGSWSCTSISAG